MSVRLRIAGATASTAHPAAAIAAPASIGSPTSCAPRGVVATRSGEEADTERLDHRGDAQAGGEGDRADRERHDQREHHTAGRQRMDEPLQQQPFADETRAERQT